MRISRLSSLVCIKADAAKVVKLTLVLCGVWGTLAGFALSFLNIQETQASEPTPSEELSPPSEENSEIPPVLSSPQEPALTNEPVSKATGQAHSSQTPMPPDSSTPSSKNTNDDDDDDEKLPEIEAKTYAIKVLRRSNSNKVYLFEDTSDQHPKTGRILLLKRESEPFMAFRILKTYPDQKLLAAKRIKRYGNHRNLEDHESFLAIEKISDLNPGTTEGDKADLKELEKKEGLKITAFDPELDSSTTPAPLQTENDEKKAQTEELTTPLESQLNISIEEAHPMDHFSHWLTVGFGYVRNNAPPGTAGTSMLSSGNFRYGVNLKNMPFLDYPHLQDSITLETGFYLYKQINFATSGDSFTVLSLVGALRYNLFLSESFGFFFYAGLMRGVVLSSSLATGSSIAALNSNLPAFGTGLLFQLGPAWYIRADIGIDSIGLNLLLRF